MSMPILPQPEAITTNGPSIAPAPNDSINTALDPTRLEQLAQMYRRHRLYRAANSILRGLLLPPDYLPHRIKPEVDCAMLVKWPGAFGIIRKA